MFVDIRRAWTADTSADSRWSDETPALGQCAVTALFIQEVMGGDLLRAVVADTSHYWNVLPDGEEIDLTREQFPVFDPWHSERRAREYVLSFPETRRRYELLKSRVVQGQTDEVPVAASQ